VEVASPKAASRQSHDSGLLQEEDARLALQMTDDRNTHNEPLAESIFAKHSSYADLLDRWLAAVEKRAAAAEQKEPPTA
jgi:hypothetical protein